MDPKHKKLLHQCCQEDLLRRRDHRLTSQSLVTLADFRREIQLMQAEPEKLQDLTIILNTCSRKHVPMPIILS